jgi:hypothetical protein
MASEEEQKEYDNGLRILARWIARAHLKELAKKKEISAKLPENQPVAGSSQSNPASISQDQNQSERLRENCPVSE